MKIKITSDSDVLIAEALIPNAAAAPLRKLFAAETNEEAAQAYLYIQVQNLRRSLEERLMSGAVRTAKAGFAADVWPEEE